jgi:hypothetical protein
MQDIIISCTSKSCIKSEFEKVFELIKLKKFPPEIKKPVEEADPVTFLSTC